MQSIHVFFSEISTYLPTSVYILQKQVPNKYVFLEQGTYKNLMAGNLICALTNLIIPEILLENLLRARHVCQTWFFLL